MSLMIENLTDLLMAHIPEFIQNGRKSEHPPMPADQLLPKQQQLARVEMTSMALKNDGYFCGMGRVDRPHATLRSACLAM